MTPREALKTGRFLVGEVTRMEAAMPVLLHGEERSTWVSIELAGKLGLAREWASKIA